MRRLSWFSWMLSWILMTVLTAATNKYNQSSTSSVVDSSKQNRTFIEEALVSRDHALRWLQQSTNTMPKMRGPRFFLLGVQKGGTTSLCELLTKHSSVCAMKEKEPRFFMSDVLFNKGRDAYSAFWSGRSCPTTENLSSGYIDCTPDYYRVTNVPERMGQILDPTYKTNKRAILVLRDPVAREYSLYGHHIRHCIDDITKMFHDKHYDSSKTTPAQFWDSNRMAEIRRISSYNCRALMDPSNNFYTPPAPGKIVLALATFRQYYESQRLVVSNSFYLEHIQNLLTYFSRKQLLVISFSDLVTRTPKVMSAIASHFGLPNTWGPNAQLPQENTAKDVNDIVHNRLDCYTRDKLNGIYTPKNKALYAWLKTHPGPQAELPFPPFEGHPASCEN